MKTNKSCIIINVFQFTSMKTIEKLEITIHELNIRIEEITRTVTEITSIKSRLSQVKILSVNCFKNQLTYKYYNFRKTLNTSRKFKI